MKKAAIALAFAASILGFNGHAQSVCLVANCGTEGDIRSAYEMMGQTKVMLATMQLNQMSAVLDDEEDQLTCIRACQFQYTDRLNDCSTAVSITADDHATSTFLDACFGVALSRLNTCLEPVGYMQCMPD